MIQNHQAKQIDAHPDRPLSTWKLFLSLPILSWALYDFANTIFSSNINTIFFPLFLEHAVGGNAVMNQIASTFISYANAAASFFLVIFSPLFGTTIDRTGKKKSWIVWFTLITVIGTLSMGIFAYYQVPGQLFNLPISLILVIISFVIAKFFYHSSLVFYDSMISDLAPKSQIPLISGFGVAVGYIGTLLGLGVYPFVGDDGYHIAFLLTGALFFLFALPLFFFSKDKKVIQKTDHASFLSGYKDIIATFKEMKNYKPVFTFMISYFFLNDAIATAIAMMAIYTKAVVGFTTGEFILLYLVSTVSSIIGSFIFGFITKAHGTKRAVLYVGILMCLALLVGSIATAKSMFWVAGSMFGVSLGAMWVTSRTYIVELSPENKRGQFFGLFAFSGKVSSILGPLLYGSITWIFAGYGNLASRLAMGSLIIMTFIGILVLFKVKPVKN
ncbi:MFS transporter [Bacillus obstructivus]|uniref:MFS transporter n=1 Tax=Heyndrickxia oleronia TaxID=38875 RepID=UPI0009036B12|nr:MFS transporter [Heyndrickxia oleronia]NYV66812.1 MFS transporter [Bacillus sp. Gen3]OJH16736.1 MFS transporter [Bacillus obstructivus]